MTEQVKKEVGKTEKSDRFISLKLLLTVALAFCAALVFRRSVGIIAMTPLAFLLIGAGAFINMNPYLKTAAFVLTVFTLNTIEQSDITVTLIYSALCLLACILFEYSAAKIRSGKKRGVAVAAFGAAVCILLSFLFIGNPFRAYKAQKMFDEYIDRVYPASDDSALGRTDFSKVYYNYKTKAFVSDGVSSLYPTETASLTTNGEIINDGFASIMKTKLAEPYLIEMTTLLRDIFPNDSFGIEYDGFAALPGETLFSAAEGELHGNMNYIITIGGIQGAKEMLERTEEYINAIDKADIGYGRIIFRSGIGNWYRRSITVEGGHFIGRPSLELDRVRRSDSTRFNRFVSKLIEIK